MQSCVGIGDGGGVMRASCRRPGRDYEDVLCFCPPDGAGYGPRQVLAQPFINGWVNETWARLAQSQAADATVSEYELWALLFKIEDAANEAYSFWRQTL